MRKTPLIPLSPRTEAITMAEVDPETEESASGACIATTDLSDVQYVLQIVMEFNRN